MTRSSRLLPAARTSEIDGNVLDTLRLGAHQLLGMRVAAHAAVDQTVGLARLVNGASAGGFVNAVMRRISEKDLDTWIAQVVPTDDPIAALATLHSHPQWIVRALRAALIGHGASTAETLDADLEALLVSDNAAAKVSLVARPGLCEVEELTRAGARPRPCCRGWAQSSTRATPARSRRSAPGGLRSRTRAHSWSLWPWQAPR